MKKEKNRMFRYFALFYADRHSFARSDGIGYSVTNDIILFHIELKQRFSNLTISLRYNN